MSDSGTNQIQANDDDEVDSRCSIIYDHTSLFPDLDENVGFIVMSIQHPPKRQLTTKKAKKGKAVTCYAVPPEERMEPEYYCLADIWGNYMRKVTLPLKYGPPHPVKGTDQRGERHGQILASSNACLTLKNVTFGCTEVLHCLQGQEGLSSISKGST